YAWIVRLNEGDTYSKIASDEEMSSGKLVDLIDEYRARVAPLAAKWDEWRINGGAAAAESVDQQEAKGDDQEQAEVGQEDQHEQHDGEDIVLEDDQQPETNDITPEDLDEFILQEKPRFEDIPYDFP